MFFTAFQYIKKINSAIKVHKFQLLKKKILDFFAYHQATVRVPPFEKHWSKVGK